MAKKKTKNPSGEGKSINQAKKGAMSAVTAGKYGAPMSTKKTGVSIYQKG